MSEHQPAPLCLRNPAAFRIIGRCLSYLRPYWVRATGAFVLRLVLTGLTVVIPQLMRTMVDRGIREGQIDVIRWGVWAMLGLVIGRGFSMFLSRSMGTMCVR